jgi:hypothetical protein
MKTLMMMMMVVMKKKIDSLCLTKNWSLFTRGPFRKWFCKKQLLKSLNIEN